MQPLPAMTIAPLGHQQTVSRFLEWFTNQFKGALDNAPIEAVKTGKPLYNAFFNANKEAEDLLQRHPPGSMNQEVANKFKAWFSKSEYFKQELMLELKQNQFMRAAENQQQATDARRVSMSQPIVPQQQHHQLAAIRQQKPTAELLASAAAQAKLSLAAARKQQVAGGLIPGPTGTHRVFLPVHDPKNKEEEEFLPKNRLKAFVKDTCGPAVKLSPETEKMMKLMAGHFVQSAVSFSMSMAKRKKEKQLDASDTGFYFKKVWKISVPGLQHGSIAPYRRLMPSEAYKARVASVRKANIEAGKPSAGVIGAAAPAPTGAAPVLLTNISDGVQKVLGGVRVARTDGKKIRKIQDHRRLQLEQQQQLERDEDEDDEDEDEDMPDV